MPIETFEESHFLDRRKLLHSSPFWISQEKSFYEFFSSNVLVRFGILDISFFDLLIDIIWVIKVLPKRKISTNHFVKDDAERPDITGEAVSFPLDDFWSHVVRSSDNGKGSVPVFLIQKLCGSEIDHVEEAILTYYCVFWFQVPVDDAFGVQVLDADKKTSDVEPSSVEVEEPDFPEDVEEVSPVYEFHQKVEIVFVSEGALKLNDQGKVDFDHNIPLVLYEDFHFVFYDHVLFDALDGVFDIGVVFSFDHVDFSKLALA